jgi:uncharacterized protein (DUF1697 family)
MASRRKVAKPADVHVALLRGINVGGKNKLPMKQLAAMFAAAGCENVQTYIQSGNVVFCAKPTLARKIGSLIADAIADEVGLQIPVVSRTGAQLREVAQGNPFLDDGVDPKALHVAFLAKKPPASRVEALDPDRSPPDTFVVSGSEIYLHLPNAVARTKLTNQYLDRTLGTTSTIRNWRTVLRLAEMADA